MASISSVSFAVADAGVGSYRSLIDGIKTTKEMTSSSMDRVFIATNELEHGTVVDTLRRVASAGNLVIGTSGFCTLDLAAVRRDVDHILICDSSMLTELFWKMVRPIIEGSESRKECLAKLQDHITKNIAHYLPPSTIAEKANELGEAYAKQLIIHSCWLFDDERFEKIKRIFKNGAFAFKRIDLCDRAACAQIDEIHQAKGLVTDTIYTSNILAFIKPEDFDAYGRSLESLMTPRTIIVDTIDQPFKITSQLSAFYAKDFDLYQCANYPSLHQFVPHKEPTQRVRQREEQAISELYPITAFKVEPKATFFYRYGLSCHYYSKEEMEGKIKEINELAVELMKGYSMEEVKPALCFLIEKATLRVLFST